jgi:hypothetical protein
MSEKMIIEFYESMEHSPIAVVLVHHCGEDPAAAALTVAGFVASVKDAKKSDWIDAGDLVSRFVLWEADLSGTSISSPHIGTSFLPYASQYPYQLVRLRATNGAVGVEIVLDEYSTEAELEEATTILAAVRLPTAFVSYTQPG